MTAAEFTHRRPLLSSCKKSEPDPNIYLQTFRPEYETIRWTDDGFTFTRAGKTYTVTYGDQ